MSNQQIPGLHWRNIEITPNGGFANNEYDQFLRMQFTEGFGQGTPLGEEVENGPNATGIAINRTSRLNSSGFAGSFNSQAARVNYPHSVLKHTLYLHCNDMTTLDSLIFIIDHTRGKARYYPFVDSLIQQGNPPQYDYTVFFKTKQPKYYTNNSNHINGYNFFKLPNGQDYCDTSFLPNNPLIDSTTNNHLRLAPYAITSYELRNLTGNAPIGMQKNDSTQVFEIGPSVGNKHHYYIDEPFDLRIINSKQKVIYNPSETMVDIGDTTQPQIFPKDYLFKTIWGSFPRESELTPYDDYSDKYNHPYYYPMPNNNNTGNLWSDYTVVSGSKLELEPCLKIVDATIHVEDNAVLVIHDGVDLSDAIITSDNTGVIRCNQSQIQGSIPTTGIVQPFPNSQFQDKLCYSACKLADNFDVDTLWITADTIIQNDTFSVFGQIIIEQGVTLSILDRTKILFGTNAGIYLKRGSKLKAHGDRNRIIFDSKCGGLWKGVWAQSIQSDAQDSTVITTDSLFVYNAQKALDISFDPRIPAKAKIRVKNSHFENNLNDITAINAYKVDIQRQFEVDITATNFVTTDYLQQKSYYPFSQNKIQVKHIQLNRIKDAIFIGNTFANAAEGYYPHELGVGIEASQSTVKMRKRDTINSFKNLSEGIVLRGNGFFKGFTKIDSCLFKDNFMGVRVIGQDIVRIQRSNFYVPTSQYFGYSDSLNYTKYLAPPKLGVNYDAPVGIFMLENDAFIVQENNFFGVDESNPNGTYGAVISNSAYRNGGGEFYRNSSKEIEIGIQGQEDNRGTKGIRPYPSGSGLNIKCNNFNDHEYYDINLQPRIKIPQNQTFPIISVSDAQLRNQGICLPDNLTSPAGNVLDLPCSNDDQILYNNYQSSYSSTFNYASHTNLLPVCYSNQYISARNCLVTLDTNEFDEGCPSRLSNNSTIFTGKFNIAKHKADTAKQDLLEQLDQGDYPGLATWLAITTEDTLINQLVEASPFLSDSTLRVALNRKEVIGDSTLLFILTLNSPLSYSIKKRVFSAAEGFSESFLNELNDAQEGTSERQALENVVDYYAQQVQTNTTYLAQLELEDSDQLDNTNELIAEVEYIPSTLKASLHLQNANVEDATEINNQVSTNFNYAKQTLKHYIACVENDWGFDTATTTYSIDLAEQYLEDYFPAYQANEYLYQRGDKSINITPYTAIATEEKRVAANKSIEDKEQSNTANSAEVTLFPNPTEGVFTIQFPTNTFQNLSVISLQGQVVIHNPLQDQSFSKTISTSGLSKGVYFVLLSGGDSPLVTRKIVVK